MRKLAQAILDKTNHWYTSFSNEMFDFEDSVVTIAGEIGEDWNTIEGDFWTPPSYEFVSRWSDMRSVVVSFSDETTKTFTNDELSELDLIIEKL